MVSFLLLGENLFIDLLLGITITLAIIIAWFVIITLNKIDIKEPEKQIN